MTSYPFPLPETVRQQLPLQAKDGKYYVDVCVAGTWDGILVVDGSGMCVGVYVCRRIEASPLPFTPDEIEAVRRPSAWHRVLAAIPVNLWQSALLSIFVVSPVTLLLGWLVWPWFALFSVVACELAIYIMYLAPGFPFLRFPAAVCGCLQIVYGCLQILQGVVILLRSQR